ncbi:MAG: YidC/Oxa1 family membrane protein insertase [Clostridia bacterium]|nr:YidC/Oxa1 family membrane protein insertase [Clostridia bacterium]
MFEYLITRPMGWIIEQIYNLVANYGLAIILFTVIIKLILLPLNIKSQKAMKKQQKVQPIIAELQQKYANDQEKLQREMMKIYKENNISMTGGCLPMLIQMPILIGLYQVIQKPLSYLIGVDWMQQEVIDKVYMLRDAMASSIGNLATATEEMLANTSQIQLSRWAELVNGASDPWVINFNFLGLDLANAPSAAFNYLMRLDFSNWSMIALLLIPILAVAASVLSMKITQIQTGQNQNKGNDSAAQMSKSMNLMMPVMTAFFTITLPSGLGIYWIISSLVQVIQQVLLNYYFDKKGEDVVVTIPEKKQLHGAKSKKRK